MDSCLTSMRTAATQPLAIRCMKAITCTTIGDQGAYTEHQFYIQGWDEVVQFNIVDEYQKGAEGANCKGRGFRRSCATTILPMERHAARLCRQSKMHGNTRRLRDASTEESILSHAIYGNDAMAPTCWPQSWGAHHGDYIRQHLCKHSSRFPGFTTRMTTAAWRTTGSAHSGSITTASTGPVRGPILSVVSLRYVIRWQQRLSRTDGLRSGA